MFKPLLIAGIVLLSVSSCLAKPNNSISISQLHTKSSGSFLIHGTCYSKGREASISDNSGSISANANVSCYGSYGAARIVKEGRTARLISFQPIKKIGDTYKVKAFKPGGYALIDKESEGLSTVKVIGKGFSNFVTKTSEGYERQ